MVNVNKKKLKQKKSSKLKIFLFFGALFMLLAFAADNNTLQAQGTASYQIMADEEEVGAKGGLPEDDLPDSTAKEEAEKQALGSVSQVPEEDKENAVGGLGVEQMDPGNFRNLAVLQVLNKITGRTVELKAIVGEEISFEHLKIRVSKCWRAPSYQRPESKMLLTVYETGLKSAVEEMVNEGQGIAPSSGSNQDTQSNNHKNLVFYGWMFASSPSLSSMEDPIYDITAIECGSK